MAGAGTRVTTNTAAVSNQAQVKAVSKVLLLRLFMGR